MPLRRPHTDWDAVRAAIEVDGISQRAAAKRFGVSESAVRKHTVAAAAAGDPWIQGRLKRPLIAATKIEADRLAGASVAPGGWIPDDAPPQPLPGALGALGALGAAASRVVSSVPDLPPGVGHRIGAVVPPPVQASKPCESARTEAEQDGDRAEAHAAAPTPRPDRPSSPLAARRRELLADAARRDALVLEQAADNARLAIYRAGLVMQAGIVRQGDKLPDGTVAQRNGIAGDPNRAMAATKSAIEATQISLSVYRKARGLDASDARGAGVTVSVGAPGQGAQDAGEDRELADLIDLLPDSEREALARALFRRGAAEVRIEVDGSTRG